MATLRRAAAAAMCPARAFTLPLTSRALPATSRRAAFRWSSSSSSSSTTSSSTPSSPPSTTTTTTDASSEPPTTLPLNSSAAVLERYRVRLAEKAREKGVADLEALRAAYADEIAAQRRRDAVVPPSVGGKKEATDVKAGETKADVKAGVKEAKSESKPNPPASSSSSSAPGGVRPLSTLIDVDKARALTPEALAAVWRLRFAGDARSLCAVVPAATYAAMEAAARARPQFVLPVPHEEKGAEVHYLQWVFSGEAGTASTVLLTQLAEYKLRGEFAQPHTTVTHYTDLAADTGVVLMQGQVVDGRGASVDDAQWLAMCLQRFYGAWVPGESAGDEAARRRRRQLLQWFAAGDPQFSLEKLMEEVEALA